MTQQDIKLPPYHLHFLVFENKFEELRQTLKDCQKNSVQKQFNELLSIIFRGQTLLTLGISLNRQECVEILLEFGARTLQKNDFGWNAWHEAISYGNRDILYIIYRAKRKEYSDWVDDKGKQLLDEISKDLQDVKFEMTWSFHSILPFVSSLCPSDTYTVYKRGSRVRIDTTLVGYENLNWIRGNISILFIGDGPDPKLVVCDRDTKKIQQIWPNDFRITEEAIREDISVVLNTPITATPIVDWESCKFSKAKSGYFAFRYDRTEIVDGFPTIVWNMDELNVLFAVRKEHLSAKPLPSYVLKEKLKKAGKIVNNDVTKVSTPKSRFVIANAGKDDDETIIEEIEKMEIEEKFNNFKPGFRNISDSPEDEADWKRAKEAFSDFSSFRPSLNSLPAPTLSLQDFKSAAFSNEPIHLGRKMDTSDSHKKTIQSTIWMYEPKGHDSDLDTLPLDMKRIVSPLMQLLGLGNEHIRSFNQFMEARGSFDQECVSNERIPPPGVPIQIDIPIGYGIPISARVKVHSVERGDRWARHLDEDFWNVPTEGYIMGEVITGNFE